MARGPGAWTCSVATSSLRMSTSSPVSVRRPASPRILLHGHRRGTVSSPFGPPTAWPWTSASVLRLPPRAGHRMVVAPSGRSYGGALLPLRYACSLGESSPTHLLLGPIKPRDTSSLLTFAPCVVLNARMDSMRFAGVPWQESSGELWPWTGTSPRWRPSSTLAQSGSFHCWTPWMRRRDWWCS